MAACAVSWLTKPEWSSVWTPNVSELRISVVRMSVRRSSLSGNPNVSLALIKCVRRAVSYMTYRDLDRAARCEREFTSEANIRGWWQS